MRRSSSTNYFPKAFTLIELLVVIAIIAILAAILFPVFAQAKASAKKAQSLSNLKNLGLATQLYIDEFDDTYPQMEWWGGPNGYNWWGMDIYPYVKNREGTDPVNIVGGIYRDPNHPRPNQLMHYGLNQDLGQNRYSVMASVADTLVLAEKGANGNSDAGYPYIQTWEWNWTDTAYLGGDKSAGLCTNAAPKKYDLDYDTDSAPAWSWPYGAMPRYRVGRGVNIVFADGHAKSKARGQLDWCKNIYVPGLGFPHNQGWYPY